MIRRPPRSTLSSSSAASDVYKRQEPNSIGEQTESAILGTKMLVSVYPSIPFLIAAGLLFFYVIDKDLEDRIESDLSKRR